MDHPLSPYGFFLNRLKEYENEFPDIRFALSSNPELTAEVVRKDLVDNPILPDKYNLDFWTVVRRDLPYNPNLPRNYSWDFWNLMRNPNIKLHDIYDVIPENIKKKIKYHEYSINLDIQTLLQYSNEPWDWISVIKNKNITLEDILAHPEFPWEWGVISYNPNIRFHHVKEHPELPWDNDYDIYPKLSKTASFTDIIQHPNNLWDPIYYLTNPNHTKQELEELVLFTFIKSNIHSSWFSLDNKSLWIYLCLNKNLSFSDLYDMYLCLTERMYKLLHTVKWLKRIHGIFPYNYIFKENLLKEKLMRCGGFVEREFAFQNISYNPNITVADLQTHPFENWNYGYLSKTFKEVEYALQTPWYNWSKESLFCDNPYMTAELVQKYEHVDERVWQWFSNNPVANFNEVCNHKSNFVNIKGCSEEIADYFKIRTYSMFKLKGTLIPSTQEIQKYFAKKKIVRILVECISNPVYAQCRKRLLREHGEFSV